VDGYILKNVRRGFSLLELSLGLVLVVSVAGTVIAVSHQVMEHARGQRTLEDMSAILQACRQYDALNGGWPSSLGALHDVLPQALSNNVWGHPFVVTAGVDRVWVETDVPVGAVGRSLKGVHVVIYPLSGKDRVRLSTGRAYGQAARLVYEKRNIYGP
jgi:type II secretory pathway pseudopilin PulG